MENNNTNTSSIHPTILALRERRVVRRNRSEAAVARAERNAKAHLVALQGMEVSVMFNGDWDESRARLSRIFGKVKNVRVEKCFKTLSNMMVGERVVG